MTGDLPEVLERAVEEGFLTATVALDGIGHSEGFLRPNEQQPPLQLLKTDLAVDLGTGGGLPGLVLAAQTKARWLLVERSARRSGFLEWAVRELGLGTRVEVVNTDARDLAWSANRGQAVLVTARSFGSPAATAEIGGALLRVGGSLVVSEPPPGEGVDNRKRWSSVGLGRLGLVATGGWRTGRSGYRGLLCTSLALSRYPRAGPRMASDPVF